MGCGTSTPAAEPKQGQQLRSFVVWGAKDLTSSDTATKSDPYCVVRIAPKGTPWKERPRGAGRRSEPISGTSAPEWRMGFTVDLAGISEPEVEVRVYDRDWLSDDDFLGDATILVSQLGKKQELPLTKEGKSAGSICLGTGEVGFLEAEGVKPGALYEKLAPMGADRTVKVEDITGDGPLRIGGEQLPAALQGLFWLSDQKNSSALASFGGPSRDGGGMSAGQIAGNGCTIRVSGDRVWAMADTKLAGVGIAVELVDLVYHFVFDDPVNPTKCQIWPEAKNLGITLQAEWFLDFEMELDRANKDYPGSVVWTRLSYLFGVSGATYALVQVIDGAGKRIEPAWSKFVEYQKSKTAGGTPGLVHYREIAEN